MHSFDANQEHLEQLLAFPTISIGIHRFVNQMHLPKYVQLSSDARYNLLLCNFLKLQHVRGFDACFLQLR